MTTPPLETVSVGTKAPLGRSETDSPHRDYPAEFEAWWATYRHRNRDVANYSVKKQIAFDAFYFAARQTLAEQSPPSLVDQEGVREASRNMMAQLLAEAPRRGNRRYREALAEAYCQGVAAGERDTLWFHDKAWMDAVLGLVFYSDGHWQGVCSAEQAEANRERAWAECRALYRTRSADDIQALAVMSPRIEQRDE